MRRVVTCNEAVPSCRTNHHTNKKKHCDNPVRWLVRRRRQQRIRRRKSKGVHTECSEQESSSVVVLSKAVQPQQQQQQQQHMVEPSTTAPITANPTTPPTTKTTTTPVQRWMYSFSQSDPRWQLHHYFSTLAVSHHHSHRHSPQKHQKLPEQQQPQPQPPALTTSVFTIWRPTSSDAIRRMMKGEATGKGLEIKGKSAKAGRLSGLVPFLQIHEESHKRKIRTIPKAGRTRMFYRSKDDREAVVRLLRPCQDRMLAMARDARHIVEHSVVSVFLGTARKQQTLKLFQDSSVATLRPSSDSSNERLLGECSCSQTPSGTVRSTASGLPVGVESAPPVQQPPPPPPSTMKNLFKKAVHQITMLETEDDDDSASSSPNSTTSSSSSSEDADDGAVAEKKTTSATTTTEWALRHLTLDMDDPSIQLIDSYAHNNNKSSCCYGIELPDRLLWQALVVDRDISRPDGTEHCSGRRSEPAFQDMNFAALFASSQHVDEHDTANTSSSRSLSPPAPPPPRVVLWQDGDDPTDPRNLVMAYEENNAVLPVVSDFDCFTMGTRGVEYKQPLPEDQRKLLEWSIAEMEHVLQRQASDELQTTSWTSRWLDVLKSTAAKGFHPEVPRFGFGDGTSYSIIESAVHSLKENGCVRHGSECFNYYFPQELDEEFLIVSDSLNGAKIPWRYVDRNQLQQFLMDKVDEGYTFPLNPKWILCDSGFKRVYDRLLKSENSNVQDSLNVWFPRDSGVREKIDLVSSHHPAGFTCAQQDGAHDLRETEAMDLATLALDNFLALRRAKMKLRTIIAFNYMLQTVREQRAKRESQKDSFDCGEVWA